MWMTVHAFSDSTMCVGVSNPDPSNSWVTKLDDPWNEHGFDEPHLAAKEVQFIWHVLPIPSTSTVDIKKHIHVAIWHERITFLSMFNEIEWTENGNTQTCLHNAKEVAAFATQFKPGLWCFPALASEKAWWNGMNNLKGQWNSVPSPIADG